MVTASHRSSPLPPDERLVVPGQGYELVAGQVVAVNPAKEPHARRHAKLTALLESYAADGYAVACDMLTRASAGEDFAPDASVYPAARDPSTGGRQLEELAFEIVATESLSHAGLKAESLSRRGVRRIFAIDVEHERGLEWSRSLGTWQILGSDASIEDATLVCPLLIRDLVTAGRASLAMARALVASNNEVIVEECEKARAQGMGSALVAVLAARGLASSADQRAVILTTRDVSQLERWLASAVTCSSVAELLDDT